MNARLIAVLFLALLSAAHADPIPVKYIRQPQNAVEYQKWASQRTYREEKETKGLMKPFDGKRLSELGPIKEIIVWHNFDKNTSEEVIQKLKPQSDFLWIIDHYSLRDYMFVENQPNGTWIDIHYQSGFILSLNTVEKNAYDGTLTSPTGKWESVSLSFSGRK